MAFLKHLAVFSALVVLATARITPFSTIWRTSNMELFLGRNVIDCETNDKDVCADCHTLRMCFKDQSGKYVSEYIPCSQINPETANCDTTKNICVNSGDCQENLPTCYGSGFLPDPLDCHAYYECEKAGAKAQVRTCPHDNPYDHEKHMCRYGQDCYEFTKSNLCDGKQLQYVVYPSDASIYVRCPPEGLMPIARKCKGVYKFELTKEKCDAICEIDGEYLPNQETCVDYFTCHKNSEGTYTRVDHRCPTNTHYTKNGDCVTDGEGWTCEPIGA